MPLPSEIKMKATAHAASAPAITTLQVKALRAAGACTFPATIVVSVMNNSPASAADADGILWSFNKAEFQWFPPVPNEAAAMELSVHLDIIPGQNIQEGSRPWGLSSRF
jgi:hypothetical protein